MARPMDTPDTLSSSGAVADRARSSRARSSGKAVLIGDIPVRVEAGTDRHATTIGSLTSGWASGSTPPSMSFSFTDERPDIPTRPPDREQNGLRLWWDDHRLVAEDVLGLAGTANADGLAIGGDPDLRKSVDRVSAFLLGWTLTHHDRDLVHAAGLVLPQGGCAVALGGTGVGKSTLVGVALANDFGVLSDDLLVVRRGDNGFEACGVRRLVALPPEAVPLNGPDLGPLRNDGTRKRVAFPASVLQPGFHPIRAVLRITHGTSPSSTLVDAPQREAFDALLGGRVLSSTPAIVRRWLPRAAALSRLPGFTLAHGTDPGLRLSSGGECLDQVEPAIRRRSAALA